MDEKTGTASASDSSPTQHAMLIVWGHFARTIGLLDRLAAVPIEQKAVVRAPQEKIVELLIGLLSGIEYLTDLSEGPAPLQQDPEVAVAWKLQTLADASGVSRTLRACDEQSVRVLDSVLEQVSQPYLDQAVSDLRQRQQVLLLDADLTGRAVSSTSRTFPGAAFGYMDGEVRLGYQLAEVCLQTELFGRQWLSAQHHPGDTVSAPCLLDLLHQAERRMGCHPRRRTELLVQRISTCQQAMAELEGRMQPSEPRVVAQTLRIERLTAQMQAGEARLADLDPPPRSKRANGPYSRRNRLRQQLEGWSKQRARAQQRLAYLQDVAQRQQQRWQQDLDGLRAEIHQLQARYEQFCRDNAQPVNPPCCRIRLDAGFSSGHNLTEVIELGYEVDTKSANPAVLQALRDRLAADTAWTTVGKNAEMVGWSDYRLHTCPYPLTVALERFCTPKEVRHAVLLRYRDQPPTTGLNLPQWFHEYNGRQSIEAGNKEEKTTFKIQHLMSRSPAGIPIQALLTVFAANFVRWADHWIRNRVEQSSSRFDRVLASPKRLVRVAANSPATIERSTGRELVRFSPLSSFAGVVIRLSGLPGHQLPLPMFANDHFSSA